MMGDVNHDNAGEAGHGLKLSEKIGFAAGWRAKFLLEDYGCSHIGRKQWRQPRLSPHFPAFPVAFNKAFNSPPSKRMQKIGRIGSTTFYGFKPGRYAQ
jgi:hypothetical protein